MAFRSFKKDIDKVYQKIDKIAKVGRDNFQEYYNYVDDVINRSQYGVFTQVLYIKYNFDYTKYLSVTQIKQKSWSQILTRTNTSFQDGKYSLLKKNSLYQIGNILYKERQLCQVKMIDPGLNNVAGIGAELKPIIAEDDNRGLLRVDVLSTGRNYTTSSYATVSGGDPSAQVNALVRGGLVLKVDIIASGSHHGVDYKLGSITEQDFYIESIDPLAYTSNIYQQNTDNKVTYLYVDKVGSTMSMSFSAWNFDLTYDKNLLNLYTQAIDYLI
jgi:hypothetical protein